MRARRSRALAGYQKARHLNQNIFAVDSVTSRWPAVYMRNHKAGCTTVILSLAGRARPDGGDQPAVQHMDELHKSRHRAFFSTRGLTADQCFDIVEYVDAFTFSFVRHPMQRAASAFADKVVSSPRHRAKVLRRLGRGPDDDIGFAEFLRAMADRPDVLDLDRHWRPQHKELAVGAIRYDYIGAVEHMDRDLPQILDHLFTTRAASLTDARKAYGHSTRSADLIASVSAADRSAFEQVMARDYALYEAALLARFDALVRPEPPVRTADGKPRIPVVRAA